MTAVRRPPLPGPSEPRHARYVPSLAVAVVLHSAAVAAFVILPEHRPAPTDLVLSIELVNERAGEAGAEARFSGTAPPETPAAEQAMQAAGETGAESAKAIQRADRDLPAVEPEPVPEAEPREAPATLQPVAEPGAQRDAAEAIELVERVEQQAAPTPPMALIGDALPPQRPLPVRKPTLPSEAGVRLARPTPVEPAAVPPAFAGQAAPAPPEPPVTGGPAEVRKARQPNASDQPAARTPAAARSTPPSYVGLGGANPEPRYPYAARRRGEEGQVVLRVQVAADGRAQSVEIATSSGSDRLDAAAVQTVERWRFRPATAGGDPVTGMVEVPITFRLED